MRDQAELKILFDGHWWFDGPPSGRNVLQSLVSTWHELFPNDHLTMEVPRTAKVRVHEIQLRLPRLKVRLRPSGIHALGVVGRIGVRGKFDSIVTQNFVAPLTNQHRTVFLHDAMFQSHPQWFSRRERIYLGLIPCLLKHADLVVTSSRAEADRIQSMNPRIAAKVVAVGLGVPNGFREARPRRPAFDITAKSFLLTVGRLNVRKNINTLVHALAAKDIISEEFPLVIVGSPDGQLGDQTSLQSGIRNRSVILGQSVDDHQLKWLYQNCSAFVFPSLDEGFGLPVVEAMDAKAKIALSAIPPFLEFGDVGKFFDPYDHSDIAEKVVSAVHGDLMTTNSDLVGEYCWTRVVRSLRLAIQESISRIGEGPGGI